MAEETGISWCDATFNPWWGCTKVSEACTNCYAERDSKRFAPGRVLWGVGSERRTFGEAHWQQPLKWATRAFVECHACGWRGMHTHLRHEHGAHFCPICGNDEWRPARMRVFCASMGDWLDLDAPIYEFVRLLDTIRLSPELDWLLLSKRVGNWRKRLEEAATHRLAVVLADASDPKRDGLWQWIKAWLDGKSTAHTWIGSTVIDQAEADRDIPKLLAVPARMRFLSIEPMLGPVDLTRLCVSNGATLGTYLDALRGHRWDESAHEGGGPPLPDDPSDLPRLDWVISGGESGPQARPPHPNWFRSLRDQCADAGVPFHFKQWGEWVSVSEVAGDGPHFSFPDGATVRRVGKVKAGRKLDGVEHNGFPA